jgi:hypothetical protein
MPHMKIVSTSQGYIHKYANMIFRLTSNYMLHTNGCVRQNTHTHSTNSTSQLHILHVQQDILQNVATVLSAFWAEHSVHFRELLQMSKYEL